MDAIDSPETPSQQQRILLFSNSASSTEFLQKMKQRYSSKPHFVFCTPGNNRFSELLKKRENASAAAAPQNFSGVVAEQQSSPTPLEELEKRCERKKKKPSKRRRSNSSNSSSSSSSSCGSSSSCSGEKKYECVCGEKIRKDAGITRLSKSTKSFNEKIARAIAKDKARIPKGVVDNFCKLRDKEVSKKYGPNGDPEHNKQLETDICYNYSTRDENGEEHKISYKLTEGIRVRIVYPVSRPENTDAFDFDEWC